MSDRWPFDNLYEQLPPHFYARHAPTPVAAPRLVRLNTGLAAELGLDADALAAPAGVAFLSGNRVPEGAAPMALAYAGHQFGNFVPQLGDGRAILLGQLGGRDIQLKGSGRTPFSRGGDGRATLGPVLREYLMSEAMSALGVPTTRALAAVATGEAVPRETMLPGAVLTRVASSHIRVGTFQYFAAQGDTEAVRALALHTIARHYPSAAEAENPFAALLEGVIARQAALVAQWMQIGFIHGVMNTDNTSVAGETIDYGPCAFLDVYDPATVFSSIDQLGRYAYGRQPGAALWNLTRLAETLLALLDPDQDRAVAIAEAALSGFGPQFNATYFRGFARKIGLSELRDGDAALVQDLLTRMAGNGADFTRTFRLLGDATGETDSDKVRQQFRDPAAFDAWAAGWRARLRNDPMLWPARQAAMGAINPAVIPRNHLVEAALQAAIERRDFAPFEALLAVVTQPFAEAPDRFMTPPRPDEIVQQTFCGT